MCLFFNYSYLKITLYIVIISNLICRHAPDVKNKKRTIALLVTNRKIAPIEIVIAVVQTAQISLI